ncbi:MAG: hypothetical protein QJR12_08585 [Mycobacterium sp.]|uniref:hypothetical protein n=1 Tax=Mycobacterium sp. TaxID=1785 RepID=UPI002619E595|nr:hypothetical protein [Mycobacterium sp.]MDI3314320.1 hypothetical protein [Mycobacterium sp.]
MRTVLSTVLVTRAELAASTDDVTGRRLTVPFAFTYRVDVVDLVERYFYRPLVAALLCVSRSARRLQSGRLDAYLAYLLIAVLAVLAVAIATS